MPDCDSMGDRHPARLLCPWDSPGKDTGVGCYFLLQRIFPTQGSTCTSCISCISGRFFPSSVTREAQFGRNGIQMGSPFASLNLEANTRIGDLGNSNLQCCWAQTWHVERCCERATVGGVLSPGTSVPAPGLDVAHEYIHPILHLYYHERRDLTGAQTRPPQVLRDHCHITEKALHSERQKTSTPEGDFSK